MAGYRDAYASFMVLRKRVRMNKLYAYMHVCVRVCTRVYARREEDPISSTLKVITLIKAVMCGDRGEKRRERQGRTCHLL